MEIQDLKEYIYENKKVEDILKELGCHSIKYHNGNSKYYSCAFPDGDNKNGLLVYDNEYLNKINDFFEIYDNNNCKRHYHEIING